MKKRPGHRFSRLLTRYAALEIAKVFLLALTIQVVVFGSVFTVQATRDYGFDLSFVLPIFWITFGYCLYYAIPISALFATGLVFGRMVADREIDAWKSFGISHLEMLLAPATIGSVLTVISFFINGYLVPEIRFAKDNLGTLLLDQLRYMEDGYDKSFFLDDDKKNRIVISHIKGGILRKIFLFAEEPKRILRDLPGQSKELSKDDKRLDGADNAGLQFDVPARSFPLILHAEKGTIKAQQSGGDALLLDGVDVFYDDDIRGKGAGDTSSPRRDFLQHARIGRFSIPIDRLESETRVRKAMPNPLLLKFAQEEYDRGRLKSYQKSLTLYHKRLAFALTCLIFPLTIALVALTVNSMNRLLPFFVGTVVCCVIFFPLEVQGYEFGWRNNMPWLEHGGNAALLALSLVLYLRIEKVSRRRRRSASKNAAGIEE